MSDGGTHRVILITGASSGVGLATARRFTALGRCVVMAARDRERLRAAADDVAARGDGAEVLAVPADVGRAEECERLAREALARFGRIDALVNNAGMAPLTPIVKHTPALLADVFAVNAIGPANLIVACWPTFVAQRRGCVVNVSTMATRDPFPGFFGYAAAKAAVNLMTQSVAKEGKAVGVRAFAVAPGAVETPMLRAIISEKAVPRSACLAPEDVADVIVRCVEGERDAENGQVIWLPAPRGG